jgi:methyl-accepting chemotaxis protein
MKWTLGRKLTTCFLAMGLLPALVISGFNWAANEHQIDASCHQLGGYAADIGEIIDRNMFERYGDVQAFTFNTVVHNRDAWYQGPESPIVTVMNKYIDTYDVYFLSLLVDLEGRVIAVNSGDSDGKPIDTAFIYEKNFRDQSWFQDTLAGRFYSSADGIFTGTVVQRFYVDDLVKEVFGDEGFAIGFSAPVRDNSGEVVALWKNVTRFSTVESILVDAYKALKARGYPDAELTIFDEHGVVLADYDPSQTKSEAYHREADHVGKYNLTQHKAELAIKAIETKGEAVSREEFDEHTKHTLAGAAVPMHGAMGFPGMKWFAMVRCLPSTVAAPAYRARNIAAVVLGVSALGVAAFAYWFSSRMARSVRTVATAVEAMAQGDITRRVPEKGSDEIADLSRAYNSSAESLSQFIMQIRENSNALAGASTELSATADQLTLAAQEGNSQSTTTATSVQEMSAAINEIAKNAEQSAQVAGNAAELATQSNEKIKLLGDAAEQIGSVIETIVKIAEQTNLLALNATIEAARAGEARDAGHRQPNRRHPGLVHRSRPGGLGDQRRDHADQRGVADDRLGRRGTEHHDA